ncbi:hypothetical protein PA598K_00715 [Paenibacillus sp. 598K]|uniref:SWIM zinc finger family protein n=1 Tax=Paenibacillus sp. 598K TaxID=1117987 RepID=UPI000FFA9B12|nr:SWIM zinc finger family protein [Paenibacillus sp. 598K]GBF72461.1 hypothetical protein PA598K_00715 [Paenibacillus sp. 598K]
MSEPSFRTRFERFVRQCTEDYLIRHANKGLYNRARKDLDKGAAIAYDFGDASVVCRIDGDMVCTLTDSLDQWSCSCPSPSICKHVLMALLAYPESASAVVDATEGGADAANVAGASNVSDASHASGAADVLQASGEADMAQATGAADMPQASGATDMPQASGAMDATQASGTADMSTPGFGWMLQGELQPLLWSLSETALEEAWFRLRYEETLEVKRDTLLTVRLTGSQVEVSFRAESGPLDALCTVKGKEADIWKAEALLRYRRQQGLDDTAALERAAHTVRYRIEAVVACRDLVGELLRIGLARLPESTLYRLETMAVTARSGGLPEIERRLRGLRGELELFFGRHVRFSMPRMLQRLSALRLALRQLEQGELAPLRQAELVGSHRSRYYTVPRLRLYGLGAEPWQTASGYRGITYYLYCEDDGELYTYNDVRPTYYEGGAYDYSAHYTASSPWLAGLDMRRFARSQLVFRDIKVSRDRRISATSGASLEVATRLPVEELALPGLRSSAAELSAPGGYAPRLFAPAPERLAVVPLLQIVERHFDTSGQQLRLTAQDEAQTGLVLSLPYSAEWARAIKRLEEPSTTERLERFHALVRVEGQTVRPISFLKGAELTNLQLDLQDQGRR